jgi:hypothetical protein
MKRGDSSDSVLDWQKFLAKNGFFNVPPTGFFGEKTEEATKLFQKKYGLDPDGIVGFQTKKLADSLAKEPLVKGEESVGVIGGSKIIASRDKTYMVWTAGMRIDADGGYRTYHPKNIGLDHIDNAKNKRGELVGVLTVNGSPVIQSNNDPAPGYYVSTTSYQNKQFNRTDPRRYLDSETIIYIVAPSQFSKIGGILGCKCIVTNTKTGKVVEGVVGDYGPRNKIGEASMACAKALGINPNPRIGGTDDTIIKYQIFPNTPADGYEIQD